MTDELKTYRTTVGLIYFEVQVTHRVTIDDLIDCTLRHLERSWDWWTRERLLNCARAHKEQEGSSEIPFVKACRIEIHPRYEKARCVVEELFPELVYDREEAHRQVKAFMSLLQENYRQSFNPKSPA